MPKEKKCRLSIEYLRKLNQEKRVKCKNGKNLKQKGHETQSWGQVEKR